MVTGETIAQREDVIRRALAMLKNRGYDVEKLASSDFTKKFQKFLKVGRFITAGIASAYFYLFILEEALQAMSFAINNLLLARQYDMASDRLNEYESMIAVMEISLDKLNPLHEMSEADLKDQYEGTVFHEGDEFIKWIIDSFAGKGSELLNWIYEPFRQFALAQRRLLEAYRERIASASPLLIPEYNEAKLKLDKSLEVEKYKFKLNTDILLDTMRRDKSIEMDTIKIGKH